MQRDDERKCRGRSQRLLVSTLACRAPIFGHIKEVATSSLLTRVLSCSKHWKGSASK